MVADRTGSFYGQAMTAGDIYTVAGTGFVTSDGRGGFSGDGGPATAADLAYPEGIALDRAGDLVIADTANDRIRKVAE